MQPSPPFPARRGLLLGLVVMACLAFAALGLTPAGLIPSPGGLELAGKFFAGAFPPALDYESAFVPPGAPPFWLKVLTAAWKTLQLGAAAASLSILCGWLLGLAATRALPELAGRGGP
jgi:ABC-type Fe3+ transport system permease subunit